MKKLFFLSLLFISSSLFAQQNEKVEASAGKVKTKQSQAVRQEAIKENWLKAKGRKQSVDQKLRKKADKKYDQLSYMAATENYKELDANEAADRVVMTRMANSYRMNGHTEEAEYWYAQVARQTENPKDLLRYAQTLQSNGNCEDAIRWYKEYQEKSEDDEGSGYDFLENCDEIKTFTSHESILLQNMDRLNTEHLEFCATPFKNGLVFTSTRASNKLIKNTDTWSNDNFTDLYFAELDEGNKIKKIKPLEGEINGKHHDGVATFDQSQTIMMFSRNSNEGKSSDGLVDLKIYMAYNIGSYWSDVKELTFNSEEFASSHPSLSADGNRIYFSSDRPGGYGGMDIYVSVYNGSEWNTPVNLGPSINTVGNELFPTIASDNTLYFSSNGHMGMGGSDIFKTTKNDPDDESSWNNRENMGLPFNSPKDDFGFSINKENNEGYLSSNRDGGKGGDDIYKWSGPLKKNEDLINRFICVTDKESNQLIAGAKVILFEKDNSESEHANTIKEMTSLSDDQQLEIMDRMNNGDGHQTFTTDEKGQFLFAAQRGKTYTMRVEKATYEVEEIEISADDLVTKYDYCVGISKPQCQSLTIIVINADADKPLPESEVIVTNTCTGEQEKVTTRRDGTARVCMKCNCVYELEASKESFNIDKKTIKAQGGNCSTAPNEETILLLHLLQPTRPIAQKEPQPIRDLKQHFLGDPNAQFYEGQVITINDIYYDYNRWNIRSDAAPRLDKVKQLMQAYPTMEIEMMSHTDSRGRTAYNTSLSAKRAMSAMKYLIDSGIRSSRLTSRGYGETQLTNRCRDGVNCSKEEHQQNRRTEIRIRKL